MQFLAAPGPEVRQMPNAIRSVRVAVVVRQIPLVTAACGTRVARPARTTMLAPDGDGFQLNRRVRPVPGDHCIVAESPKGGCFDG
jgi:hypothetical protein